METDVDAESDRGRIPPPVCIHVPLNRSVLVVVAIAWLLTLVLACGVGHVWGRLDRDTEMRVARAAFPR